VHPNRSEHPSPDHVLVHVSDPHFVDEGLLYGEVDPHTALRDVLDSIESSGLNPEAIIFSGDLTDTGSAEAYRRLRTTCQAYAERMGSALIWAMGNHDERASFREVLLDEAPLTQPVDRSYDLGGLRVIVLDSSEPGYHHGEISEEQLSWLARELETRADDGTILVMHHPPVPPVQSPALLSELRDQVRLAEILQGSDVVGILSGHTHHTVFSTFANIPVSVASVVPVGRYRRMLTHITAKETQRRLHAASVSVSPDHERAGGVL
jgi:Icc protein